MKKRKNVKKRKKSGTRDGLQIAVVILVIVVVIGFLLSSLTYFLLTKSPKIEDSNAKSQEINTAFKRTDHLKNLEWNS